ncbi:hypothetical protein CCP3SC1_1710002 [Gammaproteobacteria bacterium]
MTNSQPRASRPSAIRRRPQSAQSVDEFIQAGVGDAPPEKSPVSASPTTSVPPPEAPVSETSVLAPTPVRSSGEVKVTVEPKKGDGKTHFAIFLGVCALGVALFDSYRLALEPLLQEVQQIVLPGTLSAIQPISTPSSPQGVVHSEGGAPPPVAVQPSESPPVAQPQPGIQGVQWLALTDLQFARHDLLLGLNTSAMASLVLAKVHLSLLGKPFADEATALDRVLSKLQNTPVLSLGQLDREVETLKDTWVRLTFGPAPSSGGWLSWLLPWHRHSARQEGHTELETTDAGRYLAARLDRLKWLALWGDERGLRQAGADLENLLGRQFLDDPEAKPWLSWIRGLQRTPLRHDVTELNTLIVRLSRMELSP